MATIPEAFATAVQHYEAGRLIDAERICRQILLEDEKCASAWNFLGVLEMGRKNFDAATYCIQSAIQLVPNWAEAHVNLGWIFHEQRKLDEAASCYRRALQLNPELAEAHHNLGLAIHDAGQPAAGIEHYRRALAIHPDYPHAHTNLANALKSQGHIDEAIAHYQAALAVKPDFAEAIHNLGSTWQSQGRFRESLACYERAVQIAPGFAEAQKNLAQLHLLLEDFETGWPRYEWRWKTGEIPPPVFTQPRWSGEPLTGQTILLCAEQGFGDTLQFIRYAPLLQGLGAKVVVLSPRSLVPLLSRCRGIDQLCGDEASLPEFDCYISLLSLPGVFQTTIATIPANVPYLFADESLVESWKAKLEPIRGLRVGINWQGRGGDGDFRLRDLPLQELAKLAEIPGVQLISLQRGEAREQLLANAPRLPIVDLGDEIDTANGAFMDTAAIMRSLDLVITSDTAVAHLAGGLGVTVWMGLPLVPNWRWFLNRSDSPWYPTMRVFRQTRANDWSNVLAEMREELVGCAELQK